MVWYDSPRHSGVRGTLSLTHTPVPSSPPRSGQLPGARARVHGNRLADDEAIADKLADRLAGVGVGDLVDLVRVEPDLALATVGHGGRQALLSAEVDPVREVMLVRLAWWVFVRRLPPGRAVDADLGVRTHNSLLTMQWCAIRWYMAQLTS